MRRRTSRQAIVGRAALVLTVLMGGAAGGAAAAGPARLQAAPSSTGQVTAIVTLAGPAAIGGPGVEVTSHLPGISAELVTGTPAAVTALRTHSSVTGVRLDGAVRTTGDASQAAGGGVFAWAGLGSAAGRPRAGHGVTVAVVDTGVSDSAALNRASGRLVDGVDTSALPSGAALTEGVFADGFGHGTFMANLVAGGPLPGASRALGVAPAARVVAVKVADESGVTSLSAVLAGLDWVATHRPIDIVSLALAADRPGTAYGADPLTVAVQHLREAGLTVLVAAGNTAGEVGTPGVDRNALTVGAADTTGNSPVVAGFSGSSLVHGVRKPDLVAAGVDLLSLLPPDSYIARTYPGAQRADGLWVGSGTSQATAVAAGAAAMYLADHHGASAATVTSSLRGAARSMGAWRAGAGLLDVPTDATTGEAALGTFDAEAWWANRWNSDGWVDALEASWSTGTWAETRWSSTTWSTNPWSAKSWSAKSWSAKSWSAKSWSAKSWSAKSWSAKSWSAKSWSAKSWGLTGMARP